MAVVPMMKMTFVGLEGERDGILNRLSAIGCVHIDDAGSIEYAAKKSNVKLKEETNAKLVMTERSMTFISDAVKHEISLKKADKKSAVKIDGRSVPVPYGNFVQMHRDEYRLFGRVIDITEKMRDRLTEIEAETARLAALKKQALPFLDVGVRFSEVTDTADVAMLLGTLPNANAQTWENLRNELPDAVFEQVEATNFETVFALCVKSQKQEMLNALLKYGFLRCPFSTNDTAEGIIFESDRKTYALQAETEDIYTRALAFSKYIPELKALYDFYSVSIQKLDADEDVLCTESTFILAAWIPAKDKKTVETALSECASAYEVSFREPTEDELPPTELDNPRFVKPFETVTEMYSVPNYWERDPNVFVAIFYFIFFGLMLADVGYGLILSLGALFLIKVMKVEGGMRTTASLLGCCGISCVIWGILFRSWFAIELSPDSFLYKIGVLSPLEDIIIMLIMSLAFGVIHLSVGYMLAGVAQCKKGKVFDAILDNFIWVVAFIGLVFWLVFSMLDAISVPLLSNIGKYAFFGALVVKVVTNGRHSKSIFGKVFGIFGGAYGVINVMSDIMSYLRLFGLGLASAVMGYVFNLLGGLLMGNVFTAIFGIIVFIIGHAINLGINALGTYVHNMRLQHVEFFGRFYTGEGIKFKPFASDTRFVKIDYADKIERI
ncbi:MAG: V-type ATP synthase subunit I [Clostridia bacterium]|nr:V-type ATP synthase subunit I [Clostridia bacterium]